MSDDELLWRLCCAASLKGQLHLPWWAVVREASASDNIYIYVKKKKS